MSANWSADVAEFMRAMGQQVSEAPVINGASDDWGPVPEKAYGTAGLYLDLIDEEYQELLDARTMAASVDGAIDLIWVTLGWLHSVGVDPQPIWDAVAAANMAKSTGPVREDGKRLKPPGWTHPDIASLIDAQRKAVE